MHNTPLTAITSRPCCHGVLSLTRKVGRLDVSGKTVLVPDMDPFASQLLAAALRAFDVPAVVMETYQGMNLGRRFTSGKECFPCQITLGDLLNHLEKEQTRLGSAFSPESYVYFLPTSAGPCRFGMYSMYQRLVLDQVPGFKDVSISCLSADDAYSTEGFVPARHAGAYKKLTYISLMLADVLNRMAWRVRPYETSPGMTDIIINRALRLMIRVIENYGARLRLKPAFAILHDTAQTLSKTINPTIPRRPRIALVGEIYLRTHARANLNLVRELEDMGGEIVVSSISEWTQYVSYRQARIQKQQLASIFRQKKLDAVGAGVKQWIKSEVEKHYTAWRCRRVYAQALPFLDIQPDCDISMIDRHLTRTALFNIDLGSEAPLTIGSALEYADAGFNGIINVYPFTCMPGNACSAILKPVLEKRRVPFLELSCDGTYRPNRETALKTFMHQATHHLKIQAETKPVFTHT